jgi:hypothetical protein
VHTIVKIPLCVNAVIRNSKYLPKKPEESRKKRKPGR